MSNPNSTPPTETADRALLIVGLVAFLALLACYTGLVLAGRDPEGVIRLTVTLAGVFGVGGAINARVGKIERRTSEQLNQITRQTNGVLDARIHDGSKAAMRSVLADEFGLRPVGKPEGAETP